MSEDEKNAQIGAAVAEYQAAKVELAHIDAKIDRIFKTYRDVGNTMDRHHGTIDEPQFVDGKLKFGWGSTNVTETDLLNLADLALVITERDKARKRLDDAAKQMHNLGITSVS